VRRMRLLYLTPRLPHASRKGDQLVPYHRLRLLAAKHDITLVSFYEQEHELDVLDELRGYCDTVVVVALGRWKPLVRVGVRAPLSRSPLQVIYYDSHGLVRCIRKLARDGSFDLVHGYMLRMAPHVGRLGLPSVLEAMDSMQLRLEREIPRAPLARRMLLREELRRIRPYERAVGELVDHVVVVSELDARYFGGAPITTIPNGVDTETFRPRPERRVPDRIVLSGTMSYGPNIEAATWFAERCLPRLRTEVPDVSLVIAGVNPARRVRRLAQYEGVRVTGFVPAMNDVLAEGAIAVAPMLSGSGIQNKILEAMACGLPVVTTPIGLGALAAVRGRDILVADGEEEFAGAVAGLLTEPLRAEEIGRQGRDYVVATHSWERCAEQVEQIYADIHASAPLRHRVPVG
jgi:sugar transferase (PEP-CTERM/EpsH1 system associated)